MRLIDDEGRLLGLVNVVDAIAVLLVGIVVVAGVAFVLQPEPAQSEPSPPDPPEKITKQVTLQLTNVPPYLANAIHAGMTESGENETVATITDVERTPSTMMVVNQSGAVHTPDHPNRQDLTITAELVVQETDAGLVFKEQRVQIGRSVVLDLGNVTIKPTITEI